MSQTMESLMSQNYKISHESELWNHLEFRLIVIIKSRDEPKKWKVVGRREGKENMGMTGKEGMNDRELTGKGMGEQEKEGGGGREGETRESRVE